MKARKYFRGRREAIVGVKMRQTEVGREGRKAEEDLGLAAPTRKS